MSSPASRPSKSPPGRLTARQILLLARSPAPEWPTPFIYKEPVLLPGAAIAVVAEIAQGASAASVRVTIPDATEARPRTGGQPAFPICAIAFFISFSLTSLTWVMTDHSLPKGSSNRALRSP